MPTEKQLKYWGNMKGKIGNGFKKGCISFNKGKKLSAKHIENLKLNHKGSLGKRWKLTKEQRENHKYWLGRKKSKAHINKIIETRKKHDNYKHTKSQTEKISKKLKGRNLSNINKINIGLSNKGKKRTEEQKEKIRGEKSHMWKGGRTPINKAIRGTDEYRLWRTKIFIKDNRVCIECGSKKDIEADHYPIPFSAILNKLIVEQGLENLLEKARKYSLFWLIDNGRTLCHDCHRKTDTYGGHKL